MAITVPLTPAEKIAIARQLIKKKWPYFMATVHGMIPRPTDHIPTLCVTPGMMMGYNPKWVEGVDLEILASGIAHEASHVLRDFFGLLKMVSEKECSRLSKAQDLPINDDLKAAGWKMDPNWLYSSTYKFPPNLTTLEYLDLLRKKKDDDDGKLGAGGCIAPPELILILDSEMDENNKPVARTPIEHQRIIRQTIEEAKQHMMDKGRGSVPSFMQQLVDLAMKPSRIPWKERLAYVIRETTGPMISGGDDYSIRHTSKRSHVRGLIRPGLIDAEPNVLFVLDTSESMSEQQMRSGCDEAVAVLSQLGINEGYFCQVDAAVAEEPRKISLTELSGALVFKGRGGTDFAPGFRAAMKMNPRPDILIYFTDGDGFAPRTPCPIPTIWAIVPRSHYTRRPAPWGMVVTITDDETHPDDDEESFQQPLNAPPGYGWGDGMDDSQLDEISVDETLPDDDDDGEGD